MGQISKRGTAHAQCYCVLIGYFLPNSYGLLVLGQCN
jgi:hypothetical protein